MDCLRRERRCAEEDAHVIKAPKAVADELIACNKPYMDKVQFCIHTNTVGKYSECSAHPSNTRNSCHSCDSLFR